MREKQAQAKRDTVTQVQLGFFIYKLPNKGGCMKWITAMLVLAVLAFAQADAKAFEQTYTVTIDDYERLKGYHRLGGNCGALRSEYVKLEQGDSSVIATFIKDGPNYGGMFYSLLREESTKVPLNFNSVFGKYIDKKKYLGEVVGIEVVIKSVTTKNNTLKLKVEIKKPGKDTAKPPSPWLSEKLISAKYPYTFFIDLSKKDPGEVGTLTWLMSGAKLNDQVVIDSIRLLVKVKSPGTAPLSIQDEAFLWSYAALLANYDKVSGMVQDRSYCPNGQQEDVAATGKTAKIVAYAYKKGFTTEAYAKRIITRIAARLTNKNFPKGPAGVNALWPKMTKYGGKQQHPDFEWASGNTAFAAMDVIVALKIIGDPKKQIPDLESYLNSINWQALLWPTGFISKGYTKTGSPSPEAWDCFGMDTIGVNWAYASATKNLADMRLPPSYDGSGFRDNAQFPMCLSGKDGWLNDWDAYRSTQANTQVSWYSTRNPNMGGLFGLSAAEIPEEGAYKVYGAGGIIPAEDGNGEAIIPHYAGMISDIRLADAIRVWTALRASKDITPLTNVESMRISKTNGAKTINYLKGSWNLALQAEGWAMVDPICKQALYDAIMNNEFLKKGYQKIKGNQPLKQPADKNTKAVKTTKAAKK